MNLSIIGNPNCGKTTIFNFLTGRKQKIGNWPGVTIDKKEGKVNFNSKEYIITDLPGIYSIDNLKTRSIDEKIARDFILSKSNDIIINVIDASNIEKGLFLTSQLLDMQKPMIIILNMHDIVINKKIEIDINRLEKRLDVKIIKMIANKSSGKQELLSEIEKLSEEIYIPQSKVEFNAEIDKAINLLVKKLDITRWEAIEIITENKKEKISLFSDDEINIIEKASHAKTDFSIINSRNQFVKTIFSSISRNQNKFINTLSDKIDLLIMNRFLSMPIFLFTIYLMFLFAINIGGAFIDFFDITSGAIFVDGFGNILRNLHIPKFIIIILANGIGGGIQTVATFIPIIFCLYLFISALESSGYMMRIAFISERIMKFAGLPGKSFISLSMGFGCSVPAIMSVRTLESPIHRIITSFMIPFISCGAKLPVYVLFAIAFFPNNGQNIIFLLYLTGMILAIFTGFIMRTTILKSEKSSMLLDLPPYHLPNIRNILINSVDKVKIFIFGAGKIIVPLVMILIILNSIGIDGTIKENNQKSILSNIGKTIIPIFKPIGIKEDNWEAAVGIFTGMLAKEALVGTLDALYNPKTNDEKSKIGILSKFQIAIKTIPDNLFSVKDNVTDPLGISVGDLSDIEKSTKEQKVSISTIKSMQDKFDGKIGAFSYLLFILLYAPCSAAISAMSREIGARWAIKSAIWSTSFAYAISVIFYQSATLIHHPIYSLTSIILSIIMMIFVVFYMKKI